MARCPRLSGSEQHTLAMSWPLGVPCIRADWEVVRASIRAAGHLEVTRGRLYIQVHLADQFLTIRD